MVRVSFIFSDIRSTASYLFLISKINHFHLFLVVFDNEKKACLKNGVVFFGISDKVWNVDSKWTSLMPYIARYQSKMFLLQALRSDLRKFLQSNHRGTIGALHLFFKHNA